MSKIANRTGATVVAALLAVSGPVIAQVGRSPERDAKPTLGATAPTPRPPPTKPNFAPLLFLVGTWTCTRTLTGRPPWKTTDSVTLDPGGYWLTETETVPARTSFPYATKYTDRVTYDAVARRWIDLASNNFGSYVVDTANGFAGRTWTWHHEFYEKSATVASMTDFVLTKIDDTKTLATISLILTSGETLDGTRSCEKLAP